MAEPNGTELGRRLLAAIQSRDQAALSEAVEDVKARCRRRALPSDWVQEAIKELRDNRSFALVVQVADLAMGAGLATPRSRKFFAQALTDLGLLHTAEVELNRQRYFGSKLDMNTAVFDRARQVVEDRVAEYVNNYVAAIEL